MELPTADPDFDWLVASFLILPPLTSKSGN